MKKKPTYHIRPATQSMFGGSFSCIVTRWGSATPLKVFNGYSTPEDAEQAARDWIAGQREMAKASLGTTPLG